MISISDIKKIREETGLSIIEIKKALEQAKGNVDIAKKLLQEWSRGAAEKKEEREAGAGIIDSYIHPNLKVGVLIDLRCETDFVAQSIEFKKLAHELCLQIAAMKPLFIKEEEIPIELIEKEKERYEKELKSAGKPPSIIDKILEGKIQKFKEEISLLSQVWIKDNNKKIKDLIQEMIAKVGEKIEIKKFSRFEI